MLIKSVENTENDREKNIKKEETGLDVCVLRTKLYIIDTMHRM